MQTIGSLPGDVHTCEGCGSIYFEKVSDTDQALVMECTSCHAVYRWDWGAFEVVRVQAGCGQMCEHGSYRSLCPICSDLA